MYQILYSRKEESYMYKAIALILIAFMFTSCES